MVAFLTMREWFNTQCNNRENKDEVITLIKSIIKLPVGSKLYERGPQSRSFIWSQTSAYRGVLSISLKSVDEVFWLTGTAKANNKNKLVLTIDGGWREQVGGLEQSTVEVDLEGHRTCKEALETACKMFASRFQKPASQGNVQVFYDEGKFIWCWKRPASESFVVNQEDGLAYHKETCLSICKIHGNNTTIQDEYRFLNRGYSGYSEEITSIGGEYYFIAALIPVYHNKIPFSSISRHLPEDLIHDYEFVIVNGETRYIDLKKPRIKLLETPIHPYSTRIESLMLADKFFLFGKRDLYAKRDKSEVPFLGWELEACSNLSKVGTTESAKELKAQMPWQVMCKYDSSISPEGFETVSVPATLDYWQESNLSSALDSLRVSPHNMRSFEHPNCGFHVHVSRSALSVLDLQKMERFIHNPANLEFVQKIAGRGNGQYQKYNAELFNNRKKWAGTNKSTEEGIQYFVSSPREAYNYALSDYPVNSEDAVTFRLERLFSYICELVNHDSLQNILNSEGAIIVNRYPNYNTQSIERYGEILNYEQYHHLERIAGSSQPEVFITYFRVLFEEVFCSGRPKFSKIVKYFFPEWNLVTEEGAVPETQPNWRANLLRTKAPYKRSQSKAASEIVKGPVGKGVGQRYDALNTTNNNTVEFRMFKGTMNGSSIMRYLEFADALVRFVAFAGATDEWLHYTMFVDWIKNDPFNVSRYEHLVSFLTDNDYLKRKEIKRKILPTVVGEDKNIDGLTASLAKGFEEFKNRKAIGTFSFLETPQQIEAPSVCSEIITEEEDDPDDYEPYTVNGCDCPDCCYERGEISEEERDSRINGE